jgi:hypothetical protein
MNNNLPGAPKSTYRRGPWGTSRGDEKRFGYPSPVRDRLADIEERIARLERLLARLAA